MLLLGDLFFWTGERIKARAQYRKVLEHTPDCVEALIAMGRTFMMRSRVSIAERWFKVAYQAAERKHDVGAQLTALDHLALIAINRNDSQVLLDTCSEMCRTLACGLQLEKLPTLTVEKLVMDGRGDLCLSYLECLIRHLLVRDHPRGLYYLALRPFVQIHRQAGLSDEKIGAILDGVRRLINNEAVARDFDAAVRLVFHCDYYSMVGG